VCGRLDAEDEGFTVCHQDRVRSTGHKAPIVQAAVASSYEVESPLGIVLDGHPHIHCEL